VIASNPPTDPQLPEKPLQKGGNGGNGRNALGRFEKGWKGGPGNPVVATQQKFTHAIAAAASIEDVLKIFNQLMEIAAAGPSTGTAGGDPDWRFAVNQVLNRLLGKPVENLKLDAEFTLNVMQFFRELTSRATVAG